LAADVFTQMFKVDGSPSKLMLKKALPLVSKVGFFNLIKDGLKGSRAL